MHFLQRFYKYFIKNAALMLLVLPASTNYKLNDYSVGSGGTTTSTSTTYAAQGVAGQQNSDTQTGTTYKAAPGFLITQQAQVPPAPAVDNTESNYNKLHIVITTGGNAADAKYAVAVSSDGFVTTKYLKSDMTIGSTLTSADYQTYAVLGGASGTYAIGLAYATTYSFKVKAMQGSYTETDYGPSASATTTDPSISFALTTSNQASPPFSLGLSTISTTSTTQSTQNGIVDFSTNALFGGSVYIQSVNSGLSSASTGNNIPSSTADLSLTTQGYGAQGVSVTQSSGGPFTLVSPFASGGSAVGGLSPTPASLFTSAGPVVSGHGIFTLKAKSNSSAAYAADYTDTLSITSFANF